MTAGFLFSLRLTSTLAVVCHCWVEFELRWPYLKSRKWLGVCRRRFCKKVLQDGDGSVDGRG